MTRVYALTGLLHYARNDKAGNGVMIKNILPRYAAHDKGVCINWITAHDNGDKRYYIKFIEFVL